MTQWSSKMWVFLLLCISSHLPSLTLTLPFPMATSSETSLWATTTDPARTEKVVFSRRGTTKPSEMLLRSRSHINMWIATDKQLIPQVKGLTDLAFTLLQCQCKKVGYISVSDCLSYAASLPDTKEYETFPSAAVLQQERSPTFSKLLMLESYRTLLSLDNLISEAVSKLKECADIFQRFNDDMHMTKSHFHNMLSDFNGGELQEATIVKPAFSILKQFPTKAMYIAYDQFHQLDSVLEYALLLSWFSQLERFQQPQGLADGFHS